jgi:membrane AbrB-like protein
MVGDHARALAPWVAAALACVVAGIAAESAGLPAPWLLAGLLGGLAVAVTRGGALEVPRAPTAISHAIVGVALGASVTPGALTGIAGAWWLVGALVAATLGSSVAVAFALARVAGIDRVTATLGMLPGAAPALIAVGDEVDADARLVATMQYGRVLLVVASVPLLALALGSDATRTGAVAPGPVAPAGLEPVVAAAALAVAGVLLAGVARAPAGTLVGPLILGALATVTGAVTLAVPAPVADAAFVVVGASVGLRFDRESLRHAGRLAPYMAGAVIVLSAICATLGTLLLAALQTDQLTAYLATTPGGISSVLAAAFDTGADLTVVVAVQTSRLLVLALAAPFAARLLRVSAPE